MVKAPYTLQRLKTLVILSNPLKIKEKIGKYEFIYNKGNKNLKCH